MILTDEEITVIVDNAAKQDPIEMRGLVDAIEADVIRKLAGVSVEPVAYMDADGNCSDNNDYGTFNIPLYTTPAAHTEAMQLALEALRLPCDRWNKQQTEIVNAAIAALEGMVGKC